MNRIIGVVSAALLALFLLIPVAAAADPIYEDGRIVVSVRGDITFPAGERADTLVVVDGRARIEGDVSEVYVVNGSASFVGAQTDRIVAIRSSLTLDGGTVVSGDIQAFETRIEQAAGATILGTVRDLLGDMAGALWLIGPALFLVYLGFVIAAVVAGLLVAGLASRQVRSAEALIIREPGRTFLAALAGLIGIIVAATLAIVTIVGIPLGLAILIGFLPFITFVGYLVAGIAIGEWILRQSSPGRVSDRPYGAAVVGILILSVLSLVPFVGGLVSFMGFGAVILLMWRTLRRDAGTPVPIGQPVAASAVG